MPPFVGLVKLALLVVWLGTIVRIYDTTVKKNKVLLLEFLSCFFKLPLQLTTLCSIYTPPSNSASRVLECWIRRT